MPRIKKKIKECYNDNRNPPSSQEALNISTIVSIGVYLLALGLLVAFKNQMNYTCFVVTVTANIGAIFGLVNVSGPILIGVTILLALLCRKQQGM